MSFWIKVVCIVLIGFISTVGVDGICLADTLEVGVGKKYESIQDAVDSARSGDTVLVHNGEYKESIIVDVESLTIKSKGQWGAVLDGNSGANDIAIDINADRVKIVGFKVQNYALRNKNTGVINVLNSQEVEVKYCYFTANDLTQPNGAAASAIKSPKFVLRGNIFIGNKTSNASDDCSVVVVNSPRSIIELNRFDDAAAGFNYSLYVNYYSDHSILRYNLFKGLRVRLRQSSKYTVEHNIFDTGWLQLHDACPEDIESESHLVSRNTFVGSPVGIELVRQDNTKVSQNLFVKVKTGVADVWEGKCTTTGIEFFNNRIEAVNQLHQDFQTDEYTELDTKSVVSSYDNSSGACGSSACNPGADLKISVWPYTRKDGTALANDYPYLGDSSDYEGNNSNDSALKIPPPPSDLSIS